MILTGVRVFDVRFPTSLSGDGSDAMHKDGDYSAAYVVLDTDGDLAGYGFTFTIAVSYTHLTLPTIYSV